GLTMDNAERRPHYFPLLYDTPASLLLFRPMRNSSQEAGCCLNSHLWLSNRCGVEILAPGRCCLRVPRTCGGFTAENVPAAPLLAIRLLSTSKWATIYADCEYVWLKTNSRC